LFEKNLEGWFSKEGILSVLPHPHGYRNPPGFLPSVQRTISVRVSSSLTVRLAIHLEIPVCESCPGYSPMPT